MMVHYSPCMYIGDTTHGTRREVFWDPHTSVWNNLPGCTTVFGSPGSGKTFFALNVAGQARLIGKRVVCVDPKNDFLQLLNIEDDIGKTEVWDFSPGNTSSSIVGVIDPYYLEDGEERINTVISLLEIFLGGLSDEQKSVIYPIVQDVAEHENPSLTEVLNLLFRSPESAGRAMASELSAISRTSFGRLCFANPRVKRKPIDLGQGLTIISLNGLDLPTGESSDTQSNRLASGIMYLITCFLRRIMMKDTSGVPKLIIIDEAQGVVNNPAGAGIIQKLSLMGRSKNLALILLTQNASHFSKVDLESAISTRITFRSSADQAKATISNMTLPEDAGYEKIITSLRNGECLMKDCNPRGGTQDTTGVGTVQISRWNTKWKIAFETNPEELRKRKQAEEAKRSAGKIG